ncbi:hypothetical protein BgiBS90_029709 [Biomphalaria glabrata]|nr:hypothetical protein BgiBS90_029709 [Biomphalaria glabrata]
MELDGYPSHVKVVTAIGKLKRHKTPGSDSLLAEVFKMGGAALIERLRHRPLHFVLGHTDYSPRVLRCQHHIPVQKRRQIKYLTVSCGKNPCQDTPRQIDQLHIRQCPF